MQQPPVADHVPHQILEQQQILLPINNPGIQLATAGHVMPAPTTNWSMETMPWKITKTDHTGDVMEFTAHTPLKDNAMRRALLHQKRKSELNATATLPIKQFISEEKITAHFNGLHISSDYIQHNTGSGGGNITDDAINEAPSTSGKCFSNLTYEDYQVTARELEEKLRKANRITICEELKKFNEEQNKVTYLPEALLHRIDKPCTALVLWQPPPILSIFTQQNMNMDSENNYGTQRQQQQQHAQDEGEIIDDYTIPDVDLPPEREEDIDDFIDNNNTCNLDFNNIKPDSMDEDL